MSPVRRFLSRVKRRLKEVVERPPVHSEAGITAPTRSTAPVEGARFTEDELPLEITPIDLRQWQAMREAHRLLDVRRVEELSAGLIDGAEPFPEDQAIARLAELDKNAAIVCYCEDGSRADGIVRYLRGEGFSRARSLDGGLSEWRDEGLPLRELPGGGRYAIGDTVRLLRPGLQLAGRPLEARPRAVVQWVDETEQGPRYQCALDDHEGRLNAILELAEDELAPNS